MYASVLSSAIPVGVASQNIKRFNSLEQCNEVGSKLVATGAVVGFESIEGRLLVLCICGAEVNATRHHVTYGVLYAAEGDRLS